MMDWFSHLPATHMYTTAVNMAELIFGAEVVDDISKRRELLQWIEQDVRDWFGTRILPVTENILVRWRYLTRERDMKRQPAPATDLLIASIAIEHGLRVASRDAKPFAACGVPTFNPFTGERFNGA